MQQTTSEGTALPLQTKSFEILFGILDSWVSGLPQKKAFGVHGLAHLE